MSVIPGLITSQRREPGGGGGSGPPFASNSAYNGLSVEFLSGKIVLGQDFGAGPAGPAALISAREIPMDGGFSITFRDYSQQQRTTIISNGLTAFDNSVGSQANYFNDQMQINDGGTFSNLMIKNQHLMSGPGGQMLLTYTELLIQDTSAGGMSQLFKDQLIITNPTGEKSTLDSVNLSLDGNGAYFTGLTGVALSMDATGSGGGTLLLQVSAATTSLGMGGSIDPAHPTIVGIDPGSTDILIYGDGGIGGIPILRGNVFTGLLQLGDVDSLIGGPTIRIDPTTKVITVQGDNGTNVQVDTTLGTLISFFGTVIDYSGAQLATLTNSPVAGNPVTWVSIRMNGAQFFLPLWQ